MQRKTKRELKRERRRDLRRLISQVQVTVVPMNDPGIGHGRDLAHPCVRTDIG